jgi:hypothetical protein
MHSAPPGSANNVVQCLTLLRTPVFCSQALMYSTAAFASVFADFKMFLRRVSIPGELRAVTVSTARAPSRSHYLLPHCLSERVPLAHGRK